MKNFSYIDKYIIEKYSYKNQNLEFNPERDLFPSYDIVNEIPDKNLSGKPKKFLLKPDDKVYYKNDNDILELEILIIKKLKDNYIIICKRTDNNVGYVCDLAENFYISSEDIK